MFFHPLQTQDRIVFEAVVNKFSVNLVRNQEQIMGFGQGGQSCQFLTGVQGPGRIVGVADHDGPGSWSHGPGQIFDGGQGKIFLDQRCKRPQNNPAHGRKSVVIGIERFRD